MVRRFNQLDLRRLWSYDSVGQPSLIRCFQFKIISKIKFEIAKHVEQFACFDLLLQRRLKRRSTKSFRLKRSQIFTDPELRWKMANGARSLASWC